MIEEILQNKPKIMLLNKADKADPRMTKEWQAHFEQQGVRSLAINSVDGQGLNQIITTSKEILKRKIRPHESKRRQTTCHSSTNYRDSQRRKIDLNQSFSKKNIAKTGDRPGITTSQQWVKVGKN